MIQKYSFQIKTEGREHIPSFWAYRMYAALLELLPTEFVDLLHEQSFVGISQGIVNNKAQKTCEWTVSLLNAAAIDICSPVLSKLTSLHLNTDDIELTNCNMGSILTADMIMQKTAAISAGQVVKLHFCNSTSFKSNGKYTIFPSEELILQSLINKWNAVFPQTTMQDPDAYDMLLKGIKIKKYHLSSSTYHLKQNYIPGFYGDIVLQTNVSAPLLELWKTLLFFSEYSGIGIKTALGMGTVQINW